MAESPTSRTNRLLRYENWTPAVVERWNMHAKIRQDLYGFIDVVAIKDGENGVLAIQATTRKNMNAREEKILSNKNTGTWLKAGNRLEVWGWYKEKNRWQVKRKEITLDAYSTFQPF